ncbi:MAG: DUF1255 family protein [Nanoarchaeota archaeon]|nr:DUF1255 family protein [Nanoarchaeota archaeon]
MRNEQIFEEVKEILINALGNKIDEIISEATLIDDLGAESIDLLDLRFRLEKKFNVQITTNELLPQKESDFTVDYLIKFISRKISPEEGIKVNSYSGGGVMSLQAEPHLSVGIILPGEYRFTTEMIEHIKITSGSVNVWYEEFPEKGGNTKSLDNHFTINQGKSFRIRCAKPASYICRYGKSKD